MLLVWGFTPCYGGGARPRHGRDHCPRVANRQRLLSRGRPVKRAFDVTPNFAWWLVDNFAPSEIANTALTGPNVDCDKDGLPTLVELALGLSPKAASTTGTPSLTLESGNWTLSYPCPASRTDVTYAEQMSTNLTTWSITGVTFALVSTANGVETWRATYPAASAPCCFLRHHSDALIGCAQLKRCYTLA